MDDVNNEENIHTNSTSTTKIIRIMDPHADTTRRSSTTKKIKDKPKQKRKITTTHKWTFSGEDLTESSQYNILYDSSKREFLHQQIKNKIASYQIGRAHV